jgi:hypothetical protein
MATEPATLDYAKRTRLAWISRHRRMLLSIAIAVLLASGIYRFWTPVAEHVRWVYWSRQCAAFRMPADVKPIIDDPAEQKKFAADPNYVAITALNGKHVLLYEPVCGQRIAQLDARFNWIGDARSGRPISFVGTMRRPDGKERIVFIRGGELNGCNLVVELPVLIVPKPGIFDKRPIDSASPFFAYSGQSAALNVGEAQLDPNDAGHLRIPLQSDTSNGMLHARLQDDDSLLLSLDPNPDFERHYIRLHSSSSRKSGVIPQWAIDLPKKLRAAAAQANGNR